MIDATAITSQQDLLVLAVLYCSDSCAENRRYQLKTSLTLDQFLSSTERQAYRMAVVATGNREDALEIVQDAMFKLVRKYADKSPEDWGPLFTRIVQSTIRDWYRRNRIRNGLRLFFSDREESAPADNMDAFEHTSVSQPDHELNHSQAMKALDTALNSLPLRQQQAFLLREWQGLDVKQTASAMGCSQGSVKTHLSRALASLKDRLGDYRP